MKPIEIENLHKIYVKGLKRQKVVAVNNLTLAVEEGEIFGFAGPNGAGKSSTIKIICHLLRATSGRVTLMGKDVNVPEARKLVGYLPENPSYYDYLTGEELLAFNGTVHGMKPGTIRERSKKLLRFMELEDSAQRPIRTYSKGMVQRMGIAASLIHDPQVLIWDEPMSGLDPIGRKQTTDLMLELRQQGKTIFFSTHILADVEQVCDRIGMIVEGELVYTASLEEILATTIEKYEVMFRVSELEASDLANLVGPLTLSSGLYHLEVPVSDLGENLNHLLANGAEIVSIEPKRLRLEDVFVALAQKT